MASDTFSLHTHSCGELRSADIGETVTLTGWVARRRDLGGFIFVDLRDRAGITQVTFDPDCGDEAFAAAETVRPEWPVKVTGVVRARPEGQANERMATGEVEVLASELEVLGKSLTPPFQIDDSVETNEDIRLRYRYLDLRRPKMAENIKLRSDFTFAIRRALHDAEFTEVETP